MSTPEQKAEDSKEDTIRHRHPFRVQELTCPRYFGLTDYLARGEGSAHTAVACRVAERKVDH